MAGYECEYYIIIIIIIVNRKSVALPIALPCHVFDSYVNLY